MIDSLFSKPEELRFAIDEYCKSSPKFVNFNEFCYVLMPFWLVQPSPFVPFVRRSGTKWILSQKAFKKIQKVKHRIWTWYFQYSLMRCFFVLVNCLKNHHWLEFHNIDRFDMTGEGGTSILLTKLKPRLKNHKLAFALASSLPVKYIINYDTKSPIDK